MRVTPHRFNLSRAGILPGILLAAICVPMAAPAQQASSPYSRPDPWAFAKPAADPGAADTEDEAKNEAKDGQAKDPQEEPSDASSSSDANSSYSKSAQGKSDDGKFDEADGKSQNADGAAVDPAKVDWSLLYTDPSMLGLTSRSTSDKTASKTASKTDLGPTAWSRNDKPAGFAAVTVKQPVLPFWDTRVGADFNLAGQSTLPVPLPEKLATSEALSQSSGTAWAAAAAPGFGPVWDKTSIEARIDPSQYQSRLGTSISKTLPFDRDSYLLILQGGYTVIEPAMLPIIASGRPVRTTEMDQSAKLNVMQTGTSFIAGQTLSAEDRWLRNVGAEQKLFGGINVTGQVNETPTGNLNKSLTAGFKTNW